MAQAAVVLGLRVPGLGVENVGTTAKTYPDFATVWERIGRVRDEDDEHAAFERPRRRTQPRTKDRPNYDDAEIGRVITVDRGRYTVVVGDEQRVVTAMKSRPLGRQGVVVGDEVKIVGDVSGDEGSLARIVEVEPRRTVLRRTADDDDPIERVVVANADQLVVVAALADPPMRARASSTAAWWRRSTPAWSRSCASRSPTSLRPTTSSRLLEPLDVRTVVTRRDGDLDELRSVLRDRTSVLVGHSGVGKSTLVNLLVPDADRTTSHVNVVTGRGRQTSTSAMVLELPGGGWIIDTPGFRSFGLAHVEVRHVITAFPDLDEVSADCPRGCTHAASRAGVRPGRRAWRTDACGPTGSRRSAASSQAATRRTSRLLPSSRRCPRGSRRPSSPGARRRPTRTMNHDGESSHDDRGRAAGQRRGQTRQQQSHHDRDGEEHEQPEPQTVGQVLVALDELCRRRCP